MELKLTDNDLRNAISEAILSQIGAPAREEMIREALKSVLEKRKGDYGAAKSSVVEEAFFAACSRLTHEVINDLVKSDADVRARIEALAKEAIVRMLSDAKIGAVVDAFAAAFEKALRGY